MPQHVPAGSSRAEHHARSREVYSAAEANSTELSCRSSSSVFEWCLSSISWEFALAPGSSSGAFLRTTTGWREAAVMFDVGRGSTVSSQRCTGGNKGVQCPSRPRLTRRVEVDVRPEDVDEDRLFCWVGNVLQKEEKGC